MKPYFDHENVDVLGRVTARAREEPDFGFYFEQDEEKE
jgi:hypothetical protein